MSDTVNLLNTSSLNNNIPQDDIDNKIIGNAKNDQPIDNNTEDKQKKLTTPDLFEQLKTNLEGIERNSKTAKVLKKIVGGLLLGVGLAATAGVTLASCGIAPAIIGAIVGTIGGGLEASTVAGFASLAGIGTLIHCGLSKTNSEAYVAGKLASILSSSDEKIKSMDQEIGKFAMSFVGDLIQETRNRLEDIKDDDERNEFISCVQEFIDNKLEHLSKFVEFNKVDLSKVCTSIKNQIQGYIEGMIAKEKATGAVCEQFDGDSDRQIMQIGRKEFLEVSNLPDPLATKKARKAERRAALIELFPNPKVSYFVSWLANQMAVEPLSNVMTTTKGYYANKFGLDKNEVPSNCFGSDVDFWEDDKDVEKGLSLVTAKNQRLKVDVQRSDEEITDKKGIKKTIHKAFVTTSLNYGILDGTAKLRGMGTYGETNAHIRYEIDITDPDNIVISDVKLTISDGTEPNFNVSSQKDKILNKLKVA